MSQALRKNTPHLHHMKDDQAEKFLASLKAADNILVGCRMVWKLDGFLGQFGKDADEKTWFRSARSPLIYKGNSDAFLEYARKNGRPLARAQAYKNLVDDLLDSSLIRSMPRGATVTAEFFDFNQSTDVGDSFARFVTIPYRRSTLGKRMTIFPYQVEKWLSLEIAMRPGFSIEQEGIQIRCPDLNHDPIHLKTDAILNTKLQLRSFGEQILGSKRIPRLYDLGPYVEGIVIYPFGDGPYKIISPEYKPG